MSSIQQEALPTPQSELEEANTPVEVEEVSNSKNSSQKSENRFAQMNGVVVEEAEPVAQGQEPEEIITVKQSWQKPMPKALLVGGGVLIVVIFFGTMVKTTINAVDSASKRETQGSKSEERRKQELASPEESTGKMKADVAILTQKEELKSLKKLSKENTTPEPSPTPTATVTVTPQSQPTVRATPTPVYRSRPPAPRPIPREIFVARAPRPIIPTPQVTAARVTPRVNPVIKPVASKPVVDPMQQWLAAANIGHLNLGGEDENSQSSTLLPTGGTGVKYAALEKRDSDTPRNINYGGKQVLVGSRASGSLETPIFWTANNRGQEQKYLIKLTQPLKAYDNSVVVPTNSYVIAKMLDTNGEFVQLTAVSAVINENNRGIEKPIPESTILVLGKNGKALRGQGKKGSTFGGDFMASLLSGVGKAAEVYNRPTSQTTVSSGVATVSSSSNERNPSAGFAEGITQEMVRRMKTSNQQRIQEIRSEQKVFLIEQGTKVELFVNQSVSL